MTSRNVVRGPAGAKLPKLSETASTNDFTTKLNLAKHDVITTQKFLGDNPHAKFTSAWMKRMLTNFLDIVQTSQEQVTHRAIGEALQRLQETADAIQGQTDRQTHMLLSLGDSRGGQSSQGASNVTTTTNYRRVETWAERNAGASAVYASTIPSQGSSSSPSPPVTAEELRIRVRLDSTIVPNWKNLRSEVILERVHKALQSSKNSTIRTVRLASAMQLRSGDMEFHAETTGDKERLVHNREAWLPIFGTGARLLEEWYSVILHGVWTRSAEGKTSEELAKMLTAANATRLPDARIGYAGWLARSRVQQKEQSSLVVGFLDQASAWGALAVGMTWEGAHYRGEPYDPEAQVFQCRRCQTFARTLPTMAPARS